MPARMMPARKNASLLSKTLEDFFSSSSSSSEKLFDLAGEENLVFSHLGGFREKER